MNEKFSKYMVLELAFVNYGTKAQGSRLQVIVDYLGYLCLRLTSKDLPNFTISSYLSSHNRLTDGKMPRIK